MLTGDDVQKIHELRKKGYSRLRVAKTLGLGRGTVARYDSHAGTSLADLERRVAELQRRFDDCFSFQPRSECRVIYPHPRFLVAWKCPACGIGVSWNEPRFAERAEGAEEQ